MVDPRRLLDDLTRAELAWPELLGVMPGLLQRQAFTLQQMHEALDPHLLPPLVDLCGATTTNVSLISTNVAQYG